MPPTPYAPARGTDPLWDAYLARYTQGTQAAARSAQQRKATALSARDQALQQLEAGAGAGRDQIKAAMLSRGMYGSGETTQRFADYDAELQRQRRGIEGEYKQGVGGVDAWLTNELGRLAAEREMQAGQSQNRVYQNALDLWFRTAALNDARNAARPVGGGGGGGGGGGLRGGGGYGGGSYQARNTGNVRGGGGYYPAPAAPAQPQPQAYRPPPRPTVARPLAPRPSSFARSEATARRPSRAGNRFIY